MLTPTLQRGMACPSLHIVMIASLMFFHVISPGVAYTVDVTKFASKNAYNSSTSFAERNEGKSRLDIINHYCQPLQVNMLLRHGIRNPGKGDTTTLNEVLSRFRATNESVDLVARLALVALTFTVETAGQLAPEGVAEHERIGYRTADNFKMLLANASLDDLSFIATSVARTVDSCNGFQTGFFLLHGRNLTANITIRNDLLRFFDLCESYLTLKAKPSTTAEYAKFQDLTFFGISQRFVANAGLPPIELTPDEFASIYQIAAMEYAVLGTTSWAELIKPEDFPTLEYSSDLESYYQIGNAYPINYMQACPLLADIFQAMDSVLSTNSYKKGRFYFAHAETVVPILDLLGLFNDSLPLWANNSDGQVNRQFKTGRISPFTSNVGFVQYSCDVDAIVKDYALIPSGIFSAVPTRNMTMLTFKEAPMKYPFCNEYMCPYATVKSFYRDILSQCDFNKICSESTPAASTAALHSAYSLLVIIVSLAITCYT